MRNSFDRVAAIYPLLEWLSFGRELERARRAFFDRVSADQHILLVGEGNGRFLRECLVRAPRASLTVVDLSARMLASAQRAAAAVAPAAEVRFVQADFLSWRGMPAAFDLVVTHFFLDLFRPESPRRLVENVGYLSTSDAGWIDVDYRCPRARRRDRLIDWLQYRFDNAFCGVEARRHHDPAAAIRAAGWAVLGEEEFSGGNVLARLHRRGTAPEPPGVPPG